ncbi:MAG TPA: hypothetical protein VFT51_05300 [Bacillales bacterium]|nr:hypothetical protein [Bacillales bacterium]
MSSKKEEKREAETEYPEIQEVEHKTIHPKPDMTRDVPGSISSAENPNPESHQNH